MKKIFLIAFVVSVFAVSVLNSRLEAADPNFPEMKTPSEATQEIFGPVGLSLDNTTDKIKWLANLIYDQIVLGLKWTWNTIQPIFEIADSWLEKITGFRFVEILDALGNLFFRILNLILDPISRIFERLG